MKRLFICLASLIFILFANFFTPTAQAQTEVAINEFAAVTNGKGTDLDWVELYNSSNSTIDLTGWLLKDSTQSNEKKLSGSICPKSFRKFDFSNKLNKDGDTIRILDKYDNLIDTVTYFSDRIPSHQKGESTGRTPDGGSSWKVFTTPSPTNSPCSQESTDPKAPANSAALSLSEIFPNPEKGGKEWVEIYNPNSSLVSLANWKLVDAANHNKQLSGSVSARTYKVFEFSSGWLNNSGDSVSLINPAGSKIETYKYPKSTKGSSFAKDTNGRWGATTTPTPGKPNKITGDSILASSQNLEAAKSISNFGSTGLEPTIDYLSDTFQIETPESTQEVPTQGQVASVSERKNQPKSLVTLLIAAGVAFLGSALVWPFLEKRKLI